MQQHTRRSARASRSFRSPAPDSKQTKQLCSVCIESCAVKSYVVTTRPPPSAPRPSPSSTVSVPSANRGRGNRRWRVTSSVLNATLCIAGNVLLLSLFDIQKKKKEMRANGKSGAFSVYFFLFGVTWSSKRGPITRCSRDEQRRRTSAQLNPSSNLSEWREVNIKKKPDPLGGNVWRGTSTDIGRDSAHSECGRVTSDQQNNTKVDKSFYETSGPLRNNQVKALIHHQDS